VLKKVLLTPCKKYMGVRLMDLISQIVRLIKLMDNEKDSRFLAQILIMIKTYVKKGNH